MKFTHLLGAAIVLFAATSFAHDLTYIGPIKSQESKSVKVDLPAGRLTIEVTSSNADTKFDCWFAAPYGGVTDVQKDTHKCLRNFIIQSDSTMNVSVYNLGKESDYRIWVHDTL